jgi:hypothetical protein
MTVVSLDMAYCSFREVLAGLDTRLDTPPSIDSHHPDSGLALNPVTGTKDECKDGGWRNFISSPGPFKNEGQCVSYFEDRRKDRRDGEKDERE